MLWFPAIAESLAGRVALRALVEAKDVVRVAPSRSTMDAFVKPEPLSVRVVSAEPVDSLDGLTLIREGAG